MKQCKTVPKIQYINPKYDLQCGIKMMEEHFIHQEKKKSRSPNYDVLVIISHNYKIWIS